MFTGEDGQQLRALPSSGVNRVSRHVCGFWCREERSASVLSVNLIDFVYYEPSVVGAPGTRGDARRQGSEPAWRTGAADANGAWTRAAFLLVRGSRPFGGERSNVSGGDDGRARGWIRGRYGT